MTSNCIERMKHCIGLDRHKPYKRHGKKFYRPYRNGYATGKDHQGWDELVTDGYAGRSEEPNQHGGYVYWLTRKGLDYLGEQLDITIYDEAD